MYGWIFAGAGKVTVFDIGHSEDGGNGQGVLGGGQERKLH